MSVVPDDISKILSELGIDLDNGEDDGFRTKKEWMKILNIGETAINALLHKCKDAGILIAEKRYRANLGLTGSYSMPIWCYKINVKSEEKKSVKKKA